ncbi:N-acyl-D-amino-acid deacylase [Sphaerisporangium krabiense]|uniref:N-acyl-D-amino-acid deacylase n=2 Tax=Sphaerisporangium krabiense TaxID=763782 RepID=A0A7W8YZN6_9ACTN|nr:N-acyl-D-amino-acid deacylase [Sphaerisporangium krabiense]GII61549.1 N-acyl-D-amino-acid deacylase [Sphaerisporangium krabiense]
MSDAAGRRPGTTGLVVRGAMVADGTGAPAHAADVTVTGGRITAVDPPGGAVAGGRRVLPADGLVLAPGFVDMHAHSDLALLTEPAHLAKVAQGVTCEVLGQDGLSYAPVDDGTLAQLRRQIAGWNGDPDGFDWNWRTVGEYLDRLDQGIAVNACYLVPQGTVRALVMGWDARPATEDELRCQKELVATAMEEGAAGLSSGLTYTPGMYADTRELTELCAVVARYGGYYSPHHRSYGAGALDAYAEMVEVSRESGCPLHLAHATMNFGVNAGRAQDLLDLLDAAIARGCDITLDTYPYLPGSTTLAALLPSWASEGGPAATLARLRDPGAAARVRHDLEETGSDGCHGVPVDWATIQIAGTRSPALAVRAGRTIADLAAESGRAPFEVFRDQLLDDELGTTILQLVGNEENVRAIMRHPAHTAGSDGLLTGARPHPRAWGTFARYLGHYARDEGVLTLEECVAHLSGRAARRLKLDGRGFVRAGYHADLVLFDPATVADTATFEDPRRTPDGIPHVFVGGVSVISDGRPTGALPGRALRRTPDGTRAR